MTTNTLPNSGSLRRKLLIPLLLVGLFTGLIGSWNTHRVVSGRLTDEAHRRAEVLLHAVNYAAETVDNPSQLQRIVAALGAESDVNLILVVGGQPSEVIASTHSVWIGKPINELPHAAELTKAIVSREDRKITDSVEEEFRIIGPLLMSDRNSQFSLVDGAAVICLDAQAIGSQISADTWPTVAWMLGPVLFITLLIYVLLSRVVIQPARAISVVMKLRAAGDKSVFAPDGSTDEIGQLAGVLNEMLHRSDQYELDRSSNEKQLRLAMQDAEAANRSKSEFLANMSHEIRTPMTAILGFADVILECGNLEEAPPERLEAAKTIKRNGKYLLGLINDILDLSKIEAGKLAVERIVCSPCQVVMEVETLIRVRSAAKGLKLDLEYEGPIPETIQSDPTRLRQILINLLSNAIKFTEIGSVRLITRLAKAAAGEPVLEFDVVDTGLGVTSEQAARIFQLFSQADTSTTRKFGGSGLGLAISKRLAEALGGDVTLVESAAGVGSRFRLTIVTGSLTGVKMLEIPTEAAIVEPAAPAESEADASLVQDSLVRDPLVRDSNLAPELDASLVRDSNLAPAPAPALHGCRILLAEDGPDNQRLIAHVLKKAGAEVTVVENGKLAMDAALAAKYARRAGDPAHPFDVILMDIQMPVMDGYEATGLLREKGYTGHIIALTAHAMAHDREKCLAAGCDDYATKPIDRKALVQTIREQLDNHGSPSLSQAVQEVEATAKTGECLDRLGENLEELVDLCGQVGTPKPVNDADAPNANAATHDRTGALAPPCRPDVAG